MFVMHEMDFELSRQKEIHYFSAFNENYGIKFEDGLLSKGKRNVETKNHARKTEILTKNQFFRRENKNA